MSRPIVNLSKALHLIDQGTDQRISLLDHHKVDEIGDLVNGINALMGTMQETHAELNRARNVAENANLAKSEFLSRMSHELRTPLNAILGFAQIMESGTPEPTPAQQRSIDQILKGGWYLLALINEILDLALIESGKMVFTMESVSLSEVMHECEVMIEPLSKTRGIGVSFFNMDPHYFIHADPTRLKQIIYNLLSNAIKYNRKGGLVSVTCTEKSNNVIRISVQDTGEGLTPKQIAQLFQPFNRLGRTDEGTGIGLVF